jgi:hypothetical protein
MRHAACLPARMGGGGKTGIDALARASGPCPPHGGVYFRFREREGKALGVPAQAKSRGDKPTNTATRPIPAPSQRRDAVGRCGGKRSGDKAVVPKGQRRQSPAKARPSPDRQGERRECHAGQPKNTAPSGAQSAGKSATATRPAHYPTLLIVTRMGRDDWPGLRSK